MTSLLVGAPIWRRGWILEHYFTYVEAAAAVAGIEPAYAFVGDPRDRDSFSIVDKFLDDTDRDMWLSWVEEDVDAPSDRIWTIDRYSRMVYIRNQLLELVREVEPDYFLSLDSDILLHPEAIRNLIESSKSYDAVGGKTYMTPTGKQYTSYGFMPGLRRSDESSVFRVDVIMAIKLMTPDAYHVDYKLHSMGEDIGWSLHCAENNITLGWDGRVASKHVMKAEQLGEVDGRCGF